MLKTLVLILILMSVAPENVSTINNGTVSTKDEEHWDGSCLRTIPDFHSMLSGKARNWYNDRLSEIPQILKYESYDGLSERERAMEASNLRNCYKSEARKLIKCTTCAQYLNANEKMLSFEELENKYGGNYTRIIEKSSMSRKSVNAILKISDFFETHTPWLYGKVLFPVSMMISKLFK